MCHRSKGSNCWLKCEQSLISAKKKRRGITLLRKYTCRAKLASEDMRRACPPTLAWRSLSCAPKGKGGDYDYSYSNVGQLFEFFIGITARWHLFHFRARDRVWGPQCPSIISFSKVFIVECWSGGGVAEQVRWTRAVTILAFSDGATKRWV